MISSTLSDIFRERSRSKDGRAFSSASGAVTNVAIESNEERSVLGMEVVESGDTGVRGGVDFGGDADLEKASTLPGELLLKPNNPVLTIISRS